MTPPIARGARRLAGAITVAGATSGAASRAAAQPRVVEQRVVAAAAQVLDASEVVSATAPKCVVYPTTNPSAGADPNCLLESVVTTAGNAPARLQVRVARPTEWFVVAVTSAGTRIPVTSDDWVTVDYLPQGGAARTSVVHYRVDWSRSTRTATDYVSIALEYRLQTSSTP